MKTTEITTRLRYLYPSIREGYLSLHKTKMLCTYVTFAKLEQTLKHNLLWGKKNQNASEYKYFDYDTFSFEF